MGKSTIPLLLPFLGIFLLILDAETAALGATEGIQLCLQTVIPSLFPFFVLSSFITTGFSGQTLAFLSPVAKLLRIPAGSEQFWLVGLLGGYPVGASVLSQARRDGILSKRDYSRMMAFCSNCGPAFIFGLGSFLFSNNLWCWLLWLIHIAASVLVALLTPGGEQNSIQIKAKHKASLSASLASSVRTMGYVCGWVVLFRVVIAFCQRWFLWAVPGWAQISLLGFLELANGCTQLQATAEEPVRFVYFSMFIGFGGACVTMQTKSLCDELGMYIPGKLMHGLLSALLAGMLVSGKMRLQLAVLTLLLIGIYYFLTHWQQKGLDFRFHLLYDKKKIHTR